MSVLHFESNGKKESRKKFRLVPLALGLGLLLVVGSTLAANITLNTNNEVNFAQGIIQTVSCDADGITVSPSSSAPQDINSSPSATWYLATITISDISNDCLGKQFSVQAFDNSTPAAIMQIGQTEVSGSSVSQDTIRMSSAVGTGWTANETGTKDWSVSGSWVGDNDNPITIQIWYPNRLDGGLTTGWTMHNDAVGIVSGNLAYLSLETTE